MGSQENYVELALSCADTCETLSRGLEGKELSELSRSVLAAIEEVTT